MVPVTLVGPNRVPVPTFGLLDSGADASAFPLDYATELGIDLNDDCEEREISTAGGPATEFVWRGEYLNGIVLGRLLRLEAKFSDTPVSLLGQADFFRHFKVSFNWERQRFRIEAN